MQLDDLTSDDIIAIHQLLALYGHAADTPTTDLLREVFTADAVFESRASGARHEGVDAIQAWFEQGKPPHPPAHHTTNAYVYRDGDVIRVRSKFLTLSHETGLPRTGDYNDIVVKTDKGWRIRARVACLRFGRN